MNTHTLAQILKNALITNDNNDIYNVAKDFKIHYGFLKKLLQY